MKILHVVGARPNFAKVAPVYDAIKARGVDQVLVHTGQHYDDNMSRVFFEQLGLPSADVNLGVGGGNHAEQTAKVMLGIDRELERQPIDWVVVYGDVNSTVAAALTAAKRGVRVAHVEAGLRSYDRTMPEELNRLVTDQLADLLLTPSQDGNDHLAREGIADSKVHLVGNVMIDTLVRCRAASDAIRLEGVPDKFALVTLHRPSNVDDPATLMTVLDALEEVAKLLPVVFPVHPRTRQRLQSRALSPSITLSDPLGYLEFLQLESRATVVVTDSGGVQEETTYLGVPCFTLRENTERPVTVTVGTNVLLGREYQRLVPEISRVLAGQAKQGSIPPLWDGQAGRRIAELLLKA